MPVKKAPVKKLKVEKGISVDVYDVKGKVVGKRVLRKDIFEVKVNNALMAQAVRVYLANQRAGGASTKTRGEVNKTKAKAWRQKGTGRARHGAKSAPIWVGGGVAFGPKPRDFSLTLPKKMKQRALASALTSKLKDEAIKVVDGLEKLSPKTKTVSIALDAVNGKVKSRKILLVIPGKVESVQRAARNIAGVTIRQVSFLNTYEVLNSGTLLFMKDSVTKLEEAWTKQVS